MTRARIVADRPQFRQPELLRCCPGLSLTLFKDWARRQVINLSTPENPGSGFRPLYSAMDVLQVATVWTLVQQGLPPRAGIQAWNLVVRPRASALADSGMDSPDGSLSDWLGKAGPHATVMYFDPQAEKLQTMTFGIGTPEANAADRALEAEDTPDAVLLLNTDRLIGRVLRQLSEVIAAEQGEPTIGEVLSAAMKKKQPKKQGKKK